MALSKLHMIIGSDLDDETIAESPSAESGLPVGNLKVQSRGRLMRVTGTSCTLTASNSGGVSKFASGFCLGHHNLLSDATVRLRLYSGENQSGTENYDSGVLPVATVIGWGSFVWGVDAWGSSYDDSSGIPAIYALWFDSTIYKSIQVDISAPSNTEIDISRIILGSAYIPNYNFSYNSVIEWVDNSRHMRSAGGSLRTKSAIPFRRFNLSLDHLSDSEQETLSNKFQLIGKGGDLLICLNPNETGARGLENTAIVKSMVNHSYTHDRYNNNRARYNFEEV